MNYFDFLLWISMYGVYASFYIFTIKHTLTLTKEDQKRIFDLLIIGSILFWIGLSPQYYSDQSPNILLAGSGFLIGFYGLIILLYKKYREGYEDGRTERV